MHLVQLLLPLYTRDGEPIPESQFRLVHKELTERFGGVTAYLRSPATGLWKKPEGGVERDAVLLYEIVVSRLDVPWWRRYRKTLEKSFGQEQLLTRAWPIQLL